jgi:tRNA-binding protein
MERARRYLKGQGEMDQATDTPSTLGFDDFLKVDIRVGRILSAEVFPQARKPAYKLTIDFGPEIGVKRSSAQITANHRLDDLVGQQVLAVVNFPPRQIGPFMSEVLTLGVPDQDGAVMLIRPDRDVPVGGRLY